MLFKILYPSLQGLEETLVDFFGGYTQAFWVLLPLLMLEILFVIVCVCEWLIDDEHLGYGCIKGPFLLGLIVAHPPPRINGQVRFINPKLIPASTAKTIDCPICLSGLSSKCYTTTCFHTFCEVCILRWLTRHNTCPLCRATD